MELTHPLTAAVFALGALMHLAGALNPLGAFDAPRQLLRALGLGLAAAVVLAGDPVAVLIALLAGSAIVLADLRSVFGVGYRSAPLVPEHRPAR